MYALVKTDPEFEKNMKPKHKIWQMLKGILIKRQHWIKHKVSDCNFCERTVTNQHELNKITQGARA